MGEIYLELTVANIEDMNQQQDVDFLVDTGASRAWLPEQITDQLGIKPLGELDLELADGSIKSFAYGPCYFAFGGEIIAGNVVIGPPECEPLVGTHVLQDFRLVIDLDRHTISRSRAMKAKKTADQT